MVTKFKVDFSKASHFKVYAATGAWGGVLANGSVGIDFYIEKADYPDSLDLEVTKSGEPKEVGRSPDEGKQKNLSREFQTGLVLSPQDAFSIGAFLMQKAVEAGHTPPKKPNEGIQ